MGTCNINVSQLERVGLVIFVVSWDLWDHGFEFSNQYFKVTPKGFLPIVSGICGMGDYIPKRIIKNLKNFKHPSLSKKIKIYQCIAHIYVSSTCIDFTYMHRKTS